MAIEFTLPALGENIAGAEVVQVLVAVGDHVRAEDPVLEVETEKAVFDVPSAVSGRVTQVHVAPGDTITVGQLLLTIEETGA